MPDAGENRARADGRWTDLGRWCSHPHDVGDGGAPWIAGIALDPVPSGQLILLTEVGWVPYSGHDNARAQASAGRLGRRHLRAGTVSEFMLVPDSVIALPDGQPVPRYEDPRFAQAQNVLSLALAEKEGRFCVADWIRTHRAA